MKFQAHTEDELAREGLLDEGQYPFTIKASAEKQDKKQRGFFALKLFVHGPNERDWHVFDNVSPEWMAFKLRHLAFAIGLGGRYESGELTAEELVGRQGHCVIGVQDAKGGYPAKNVVLDYVVPQPLTAASQAAKNAPEEPDDVPF